MYQPSKDIFLEILKFHLIDFLPSPINLFHTSERSFKNFLETLGTQPADLPRMLRIIRKYDHIDNMIDS